MDFSDGELQRIQDELYRSGYPLEHRVAAICRAANRGPELGSGQFQHREDRYYRRLPDATWEHIPTPFSSYPAWPHADSMWSAQRVVYRDTRQPTDHPAVWREVDREATFQCYAHVGFEDTEDATISLETQVLIECKHREQVMLVGFIDDERPQTVFPILSPLAHTRLVKATAQQIPQPFADIPRVIPSALEKKDKTGWHSYKENLVYNAAGTLYDYLTHRWSGWAGDAIHPFLQEQGLWESLAAQIDSPHFTLGGWIHHHVTEDHHRAFNATHAQWNLISPLVLTVPIVCVDMPLYRVQVAQDGTLGDLIPTQAMIVEERVHSWPTPCLSALVPDMVAYRTATAAPVLLVHRDGLMDIFCRIARWVTAWHEALDEGMADPALVAAWPLEEALWNAYYLHRTGVHDLDDV